MNVIIRYCFVLLIVILCDSCFFAAGSYPYAKYYNIDITQEFLISRIENFKENNPNYKIFINEAEKKDYIDERNFYHPAFFIKEKNIIIYAVVNLNGDNSSGISTIGIDCILDDVGKKEAQYHQLSKERKKEIQHIFETEILDKIGKWWYPKWYE